jgi:hypothetical protein
MVIEIRYVENSSLTCTTRAAVYRQFWRAGSAQRPQKPTSLEGGGVVRSAFEKATHPLVGHHTSVHQ